MSVSGYPNISATCFKTKGGQVKGVSKNRWVNYQWININNGLSNPRIVEPSDYRYITGINICTDLSSILSLITFTGLTDRRTAQRTCSAVKTQRVPNLSNNLR